MINFTYNRWLACLILIGFIASLAIGWQRHKVEEANSTVEIIMSYDDIAELAVLEGISQENLFILLKRAGLTSVSVNETTLKKLSKKGEITAMPGTAVIEQLRAGVQRGSVWHRFATADRPENIQARDVYILVTNKNLFEELKSDLERRLAKDRVRVLFEGATSILAIKADYEKVIDWNLGLPSKELKEIAGHGLYVVPRPSNYTKVSSADIEAVFERLSVIDRAQISAIVFAGDEALGYPNLIPKTAEEILARGFNLGLIEHPVQLQFFKQDGLLSLAALTDYKAIRLYSIFRAEQLKLDPAEAVRRHANTSRERNVRLNLLRPFEKPEPGMSLFETGIKYVASTKEALQAKGFKLGRAQPYQPYFAPVGLLAVVVLGICAASVTFLANIIYLKDKWQYILVAISASILTLPILEGAGTLARQTAALAAVCIFPVLAMAWQVSLWQKRLDNSAGIAQINRLPFAEIALFGVGSLILATLGSLAGGIYTGAVLSDIRFFLEIEIFRGVKLSFIAPLILISLICIANLDRRDNISQGLWQKTKKVLNYPVLLRTLLLFGVAAVAVWIFVGRSGHTAGIPVPGIELKLRLFLEETLYARPRGKEFLIGHPAFLLLLGAMRFKWPSISLYIFLVAATIGQSSIAETFAHMRTPIYMSVLRGVDGLWIGILIGLAVLGVCYAFMRFNPIRPKENSNP